MEPEKRTDGPEGGKSEQHNSGEHKPENTDYGKTMQASYQEQMRRQYQQAQQQQQQQQQQ